jgi:hypothetical protein
MAKPYSSDHASSTGHASMVIMHPPAALAGVAPVAEVADAGDVAAVKVAEVAEVADPAGCFPPISPVSTFRNDWPCGVTWPSV